MINLRSGSTIAALLATAALVAGCGSSGSGSSSGSSSSSSSSKSSESSSSSGSSSNKSSETKTTDTTLSVPTDSADLKVAAEECNKSIDQTPGMSSSLKATAEKVCNDVGKGDIEAARKDATALCTGVAEAAHLSSSEEETVVNSCKQELSSIK